MPDIIVNTQFARMRSLQLECGKEISDFTLAYECYGKPNSDRTNAILVCHGLTADAHAAGKHHDTDARAGWWDAVIGPGRMLDTDRYFVICSNVLGGCGGSTGPSSIDQSTGRPYAMSFPVLTIWDMVQAQRQLLDHLGISRLYAAIGGCMGGFQVLEWARRYPDAVDRAVVIGATPSCSAYTIALWHILRRTITADPQWNEGNYYDNAPPKTGLGLSTALGLLIWMGHDKLASRFGRLLANGNNYSYSFDNDFAAEAFFANIEASASTRFDANSLLYLMRTMTYFDLTNGFSNLTEALAAVRANVLLVSYLSDWRYPPEAIEPMRAALNANNIPAEHTILESDFGHGAFLLDPASLIPVVQEFLSRPTRRSANPQRTAVAMQVNPEI